jgi:hypothetical protein
MTRRLSTSSAAFVLPASVVAVGLVGAALLAARGPAEIAVHWNAAGQPDGYAAPWTVVAQIAVLGIGLTVLFGVLLLLSRPVPQAPSPVEKLLVSAAAGTTALVVAAGIWILATQPSTGAGPAAWPGVLLVPAAVAVAAVGAWLLTPRAVDRRPRDPQPTPPIALAATERAVWIGTARMPRGAIAGIGAGVLALLALVAFAVVTSDGRAWPVLIIPVAIGALLLGLSSYTVRVDEAGLRVRALLGIPVWRIAAAEIASAGIVTVAPLAEFGGWGVRIGRGARTGVITRRGEALQVRRHGGRALVVTVDDAGTAAALLNAVAERATAGGAG